MENFEANQLTLAERRELAVFNIIKRPVSVYKKYLIELGILINLQFRFLYLFNTNVFQSTLQEYA